MYVYRCRYASSAIRPKRENQRGCISLNHPILLMIFIREAIPFVSKVSTYETKHFLICIMIFPLSPSKRALNSA